MSFRSWAPLVAAAFVWSPAAFAGSSQLYVIPGVGPEEYAPVATPRSHVGAPVANRGAVTYTDPHRETRGHYGGGFLELLVTGRDPTPRRSGVIYNSPAPRYEPLSYAPQPAHGRVYVAAPEPAPARLARPQQMAAYAPQPAPAVGMGRVVDPMYYRQEVDYRGPHAPGTIVVDTPRRFLFLVQPGGRALRYGIGVGRPGFEWSGMKRVTRKAEWPSWTPPAEMLRRRPDLPRFMAGGPENPLGARALYLGSSLYRIHGTNEPWTIGQNVSSGCIRMMNDDVTDLYGRVRVGAKVHVI